MAAKTTTRAIRNKGKNTGGRPPKFREPSRSVTVTLPQRTLELLRWIDSDRAKAVVKAVDSSVADRKAQRQVEVIEVAPGTGMLVVQHHSSLRSISWLKLIQIAPAQYLLTIESGTSIEKVEVALMDLIDDAKRSTPENVPALELLRETLGKLRRDQKISKAEVLIVDIEP